MQTYELLQAYIHNLLKLAREQNDILDMSRIPSVELKLIGTKARFLICGADPNEDHVYHGLFDLDGGQPEICAFSLREIYAVACKSGHLLSVIPLYGHHDLDYYRARSRHACVSVTNTLN